jgi:hypothetical protein
MSPPVLLWFCERLLSIQPFAQADLSSQVGSLGGCLGARRAAGPGDVAGAGRCVGFDGATFFVPAASRRLSRWIRR